MESPRVVITDSPFPNLDPSREVLSRIGAFVEVLDSPTPAAIQQASEKADAVLVTYAKITVDAIRQMKRCRIISRFGIGVDNVDIAAATAAGIVVTKVPDYCVEEVADHTLALLLALARKITFANSMVHAGRWGMAAVVPVHRLCGTVLGLVGFGRIPQLVAPRAASFGIRVIASDPYLPAEVITRAGVEFVQFPDLVRRSDYISIHSPLVPETQGLFNSDVFREMKPTAYLINTARGAIVDEVALAQVLDASQLAGAALDVLPQEPPLKSPLLGRSNVILTPHMSFYSVESLIDLQIRAAEEVVRALTGEKTLNPVNPEAAESNEKRGSTSAK